MPRVRVPNVSLVANAELPILPFLAPRLFADSSRTQQQDGKTDGAQKEKKKAIKPAGSLDWRDHGQKRGWSNGVDACLLRKREEGTTTALLQTSKTRWNAAINENRPRDVNCIYADISSIALRQMRGYATTDPANQRAIRGKRHTSRKVGEKSRISVAGAVGKTKSPKRGGGAGRLRTSSILAPNGHKLATQREKALVLEHQRLSELVSRLPSGHPRRHRLQKGQYRSICRRIYNLRHWDTTQIDLGKLPGGTKNASWLIREFAALDRAVYASIGRHTRRIVLTHDPRCVRWSRTLFPAGTKVGSHQVWTTWMGFDVATRRKAFRKLLVYLLDRKPGRALRFIQVLANDPLLRNSKTEIIADALGHLSKLHSSKIYTPRKEWGQDAEANKRSFVPAFVHIFRKALAGIPDVCSQDLLYNVVRLSTTEDLKKVFDCLVAARTRLSFDTLLHYANAFGEASEVQYALRCLQELKLRHGAIAWQSIVDRERLRWTCALILRKSVNNGQNYHETPEIVAAFVKLGVKMDILLYNVVMHNAMEAGDHVTAFKVYDTLESNALDADKHTFSILLHGCTSQSNPAMFHTFAQNCAEVAKEMRDPWLATDYLYYLYVRHQNDSDAEHRSKVLWQAYLNHFSVPLELFARPEVAYLKNVMDAETPRPDSTTLEPTSVALYIMLQVELESALAVSNERVLSLYQRFKALAITPKFKPLVRDPTVWNAFLLAFCQKQQFASASQLITDMMNSSPQPNVYSWNIFMQAFFKTGQVQAAERVFEIMRHKSIEPDQFSYGVMLRGYAKMQLVERIGDTMQYLNAEQEMDPELLRALAQVVKRKQLMTTLENSRAMKEKKAREKADRDAEEEQERWREVDFSGAAFDAPSVAAESVAPGMKHLQEPLLLQESTIDQPLELAEEVEEDSIFRTPPPTPQDSPFASQEQPTLLEKFQPTSQQPLLDPQTIHKDTQASTMTEEAEEEMFTFLQDSTPSPQEDVSPSTLPETSQGPSPPPATTDLSQPHESRNPKVQFRELQQKLGTERLFGANLGFKSMLASDEKASTEVDSDLAGQGGEMSFASMLSERAKLGGEEQKPQTKLRKIAVGDVEEKAVVAVSKEKKGGNWWRRKKRRDEESS